MLNELKSEQRKPYNGDNRSVLPKSHLALKTNFQISIQCKVYILLYDVAENIIRADSLDTTYFESNSSDFYLNIKVIKYLLNKF